MTEHTENVVFLTRGHGSPGFLVYPAHSPKSCGSQEQWLRLIQPNPILRSKRPCVRWLGEAMEHTARSWLTCQKREALVSPEKGSSGVGRNNHSLSKQLPSEWTACEMLVTEYEAAEMRLAPHTRRYHLCHRYREKEFPNRNGSSHQRQLLSGRYNKSGGITTWVARIASKNRVDW